MTAPEPTVHSPRRLDEALALLAARGPEVTVLAGGTDLMVGVQAGASRPGEVLNLWGLDALRGIEDDGDAVLIGALETYSAIIASPLCREHLPALVAAARAVGAVQIQNRGTLGGNLANASPAADTPPVLMAADATVMLCSQAGTRTVPVDHFFLGYKRIDRRPDELIAHVRVPKCPPAERDLFEKVGTRQAQAISKVVLGARIGLGADGAVTRCRIAAGSVAPTTVRLTAAEAVLRGQVPSATLAQRAGAAAAAEVRPIDDIRSTATYRATVTGNLVARWVRALAAGGAPP